MVQGNSTALIQRNESIGFPGRVCSTVSSRMGRHASIPFHAAYSVRLDGLSSHNSFHAPPICIELHETALPCKPHCTLFYHQESVEGISSLPPSNELCTVRFSRIVSSTQHRS